MLSDSGGEISPTYVCSMTLTVMCTVLHGVLTFAANWLLMTQWFEECPGH